MNRDCEDVKHNCFVFETDLKVNLELNLVTGLNDF